MSLDKFMELFVGRTDVFAEQQADGSYLPVRRPITRQDYNDHGFMRHTYGIYTVVPDVLLQRPTMAKTKLLVFDVDVMDRKVVYEITGVLAVRSIDYWVEFSGKKGHHVWVFLEDWMPAAVVRRAGAAVLQLAGVQCEEETRNNCGTRDASVGCRAVRRGGLYESGERGRNEGSSGSVSLPGDGHNPTSPRGTDEIPTGRGDGPSVRPIRQGPDVLPSNRVREGASSDSDAVAVAGVCETCASTARTANANLRRVEVFPKQDQLTGEGLGNLVKLPLGVHQVSGKRSVGVVGDWRHTVRASTGLLEALAGEFEEPPRPPAREPGAWVGLPLPPCMERVRTGGVSEGKRDQALYALALECKGRGVPEPEALAICDDANSRFSPPLSTYVVQQKVRSAYVGPFHALQCSREFLHDPDGPLCSTACPRQKVGPFRPATEDGPPGSGAAAMGPKLEVGQVIEVEVTGQLRRPDGRVAYTLSHPAATNTPVLVV